MKKAINAVFNMIFHRGKKLTEPYPISSVELTLRNKKFDARRVYNMNDYERLLSPYMGSHVNMTYDEYVREADTGDHRVLLIRHDIDHDYQTAVRIAEWEHSRGLKATYCVLHSAWYYGHLDGDRIIHTSNLIEFTKRLVDLGHEINFHNNLLATALTHDVDPLALLRQELDFFRSIGIVITGTSSHGDGLCHKLNFRNWELFKECVGDAFGGPRTIYYESSDKTRSVRAGEISMFDFGLTYEGYDVMRDIYHTESGGKMRTRHKAKGRRPFGRKNPEKGEVVGVLTHPCWWKFD